MNLNPSESSSIETLDKIDATREVDIKECIENYGVLISDSLNVDNKPLIECLERISDALKGYLILISKVGVFLN
jgi:hypothetical protein